jgi:hypothetical protein
MIHIVTMARALDTWAVPNSEGYLDTLYERLRGIWNDTRFVESMLVNLSYIVRMSPFSESEYLHRYTTELVSQLDTLDP